MLHPTWWRLLCLRRFPVDQAFCIVRQDLATGCTVLTAAGCEVIREESISTRRLASAVRTRRAVEFSSSAAFPARDRSRFLILKCPIGGRTGVPATAFYRRRVGPQDGRVHRDPRSASGDRRGRAG
jgi:hypothetical protein